MDHKIKKNPDLNEIIADLEDIRNKTSVQFIVVILLIAVSAVLSKEWWIIGLDVIVLGLFLTVDSRLNQKIKDYKSGLKPNS